MNQEGRPQALNAADSDSHVPPGFEALCASVDRLAPQLVELRRELHQYPEVSGQEFATTQRLADALSQAGLQSQISPTGRGATCELVPEIQLCYGSYAPCFYPEAATLKLEESSPDLDARNRAAICSHHAENLLLR